MVIIVVLAALAVILIMGIGFHLANGARSGKSGAIAKPSAPGASHIGPQQGRASDIN